MKSRTCFRCRLLIASGLAVLAVACSDPQVSREKYFAQANAAFEQKKYPDAIIAYRNALKADPLYGEARLKLAEAYERQGELANASARVCARRGPSAE